jgi:hypothetical protein
MGEGALDEIPALGLLGDDFAFARGSVQRLGSGGRLGLIHDQVAVIFPSAAADTYDISILSQTRLLFLLLHYP